MGVKKEDINNVKDCAQEKVLQINGIMLRYE